MTKQPSYRFVGYIEPWEQRKLSEITDYKNGKGYEDRQSDSGSCELINLNSISIDGGLKRSGKFIDKADETLEKGDLVMILSDVGHGNLLGRVAIIPESNKFVLNQRVALLRPRLNSNSQFLYSYINSNQYYFKSQGAGMSQLNISKSSVENFSSYIPTLPEQTAIGSFFQDIDQLISLQQRKLEVLKEQKKTYLKLLFPAKGQTKPALRFAGFEDEWKEVKLGEYCCIATGKLDANAMVPDGEYDFYTSGIQKYKIDVPAFEGPAITIAGNGATVGYMHYADGQFNAYQRTYVLSNFLVDRSFIYSEIGRKLPSKIQQEARTGNIPYIVMDMLTKLDICLPSLPEQEAIGSFFQDLDKAIAKEEEKVNQLKESKQTLLRKMFI